MFNHVTKHTYSINQNMLRDIYFMMKKSAAIN